VPCDHWLEPWEKVAIISFHHQFPLEGYRRLTFMMLDRNVAAVIAGTFLLSVLGLGWLFASPVALRVAMTELPFPVYRPRETETANTPSVSS
jgi:hypothetical protein